MNTCPHCGHGLGGGESHCPHCGTEVKAIWPPPPTGLTPPPVAGPRLLTGTRGGDIAASLATGATLFVAFVAFLLHIVLAGVAMALLAVVLIGLHSWARPRYSFYARSLGWMVLALVLVGMAALLFVI